MEERSENLKTTNRDLSPISDRQNIITNKNIIKSNNINKKYNSKNLINSSIRKKLNNNINKNTIDSNNSKSLLESNLDEKSYQNLATNVRIQKNLIEEYQKWVTILLGVINNKKIIDSSYNDVGTPIQEGLEDIEKLKLKNLEIKTLIIKNKINNEIIEKQLEKNKKMQNMLIKEFNEKDKNKEMNLKKEKEQLIFNVQMLANELDDVNENNKQLYDKIQNNNNMKKIYDLVNTKNQLKEENKLYKKMVVLKNRKNYMDLKGSLSFSKTIDNSSNIKSRKFKKKNNNVDISEEYGSIGPISGYGEYKLEKEENINKNFFFCGL